MDAITVLYYAHQHVLEAVGQLDEADWNTPYVCGVWSVKDIIAHLASHEQVLTDVLQTFLDSTRPTPYLDQMDALGDAFNDEQVAMRYDKSAAEVLKEYKETHARAMELARLVPAECYGQSGTLPWYGKAYALDDLIAYGYYGHKREHCAQIAVFRDSMAQTIPVHQYMWS